MGAISIEWIVYWPLRWEFHGLFYWQIKLVAAPVHCALEKERRTENFHFCISSPKIVEKKEIFWFASIGTYREETQLSIGRENWVVENSAENFSLDENEFSGKRIRLFSGQIGRPWLLQSWRSEVDALLAIAKCFLGNTKRGALRRMRRDSGTSFWPWHQTFCSVHPGMTLSFRQRFGLPIFGPRPTLLGNGNSSCWKSM